MFDHYFLEILDGFLRNARKTSSSFAVCDFPDGTLLKGCVAKSGKTYVSVARMLPALAAWVAGGKRPTRFPVGGESLEMTDVLLAIFRHAFDPAHADYWQEPPTNRASQLQVEAAQVAWSLYLLGDPFLSRLSSPERARIQAWLASCTRVAEREHNHAWFSAINQAARLALSARWKEFAGDEAWMLADLKAMDTLAVPGDDGWYTDSRTEATFDYYNFWTYASHFLYWNRIAGARYPEWAARFRGRLERFLPDTPYFFAGNGSHVLFGRSLIYRWAALTPLVLAYEQKLWPHSPGLLRRIVRRSLLFHWENGAFDKERGKLRETFTPQGNPDLREMYIDNGHPYWCQQAFALYLIPEEDPFWTSQEESLPIERGDFQVRFEGARMLLAGTKHSGQVRWLQSQNAPRRNVRYRDKYIKFSYSSHFPFNILEQKDRCPWDQALVFRDRQTRAGVGRAGVRRGELIGDGVQTRWWAQLGEMAFEVTSRIRVYGEFEERTHHIVAPAGALEAGIEIVEGSYPLGLMEDEEYEQERSEGWQWIRSRRTGHLIVTWNICGYERMGVDASFEEGERENVNILSPRMAVNTPVMALPAERITVASLHYASPLPLDRKDIFRRADELTAAWKTSRPHDE